jgi:hypothetical protein
MKKAVFLVLILIFLTMYGPVVVSETVLDKIYVQGIVIDQQEFRKLNWHIVEPIGYPAKRIKLHDVRAEDWPS